MKFLKLDKKKGSGGPSIKSRFAYLILIDDIASFPVTNEKGVRLVGDIVLKDECTMMPLYLTNSSQEFSYETLGDDDEKNYKVKFSGNHPGTELEALEFAKNMIEQPYLVLIPGCNTSETWKLLGEIDNPLIFTSSHKASKDGSKFTFNFEQRIGSEFIYFSYGGVEVPSGDYGTDPPSGGFDPSKWARIDASNIDPYIAEWRDKLGINSGSIKNYPTLSDFPIPGDITTIYKALDTDELYIWDAETGTYLLSSIDDGWKNYVELSIGGLQTSIDGINSELVTVETRLDDLDDNDNSLQDQITAEITVRQNADIAEANDRTFADGVLDGKITTEKNRNDSQDSVIAGNTAAIALKLDKPLAPNNTTERLINADGSTSDKGDFQLSEQIEISTSQTAQDAWKGKEIWVTASCTLTIPAPSALSAAWNIDILVFPSVTLTLAITSGGTWLHTTPGTVSDAFFRIARRGNTTTFKTLGL